jgi:lipopolysaccharide transport system permease protein
MIARRMDGIGAAAGAKPPTLAPSAAPGEVITVIEPTHGWRTVDLRALWRYRELLYFLAWRDVKVRYKQTALGAAWALLQPLGAMAIFTLFFGRLLSIPSDGIPYPVFAYAALLPWTYFANATTNASSSLVANANLISKVYFPRLVVPIAGVLPGLVDLAIGLVLMVGLMALFGIAPTLALLLVPVFVLLALATAVGVGVWLSALDVQYRDVRYAVPFAMQVWMFATPVVYPASIVPPQYQALYGLNPMAGVVTGFRWALLGGAPPSPQLLLVSAIGSLVLLGTGLLYFRRVERRFADVV